MSNRLDAYDESPRGPRNEVASLYWWLSEFHWARTEAYTVEDRHTNNRLMAAVFIWPEEEKFVSPWE